MKKIIMVLVVIVVYQVNNSWAIDSYTDFPGFNSVSGPLRITYFDDITPGSTFAQPAVFDDVSYYFSSYSGLETSFKIFSFPLSSISAPNILGAAKAIDGTFDQGTTTLLFPYGTSAAGLYLIMLPGYNSSLFATSTVVAEDYDGNQLTIQLIFQGQVGEKRFIGFKSTSGISSINFTSVSHINGLTSLSMDNVCYSLISDLDIDNDYDGFTENDGDCDDDDDTIYPGASEVKHDGIDQDCNGYDLTIEILEAKYSSKRDNLKVEASSDLGQEAMLELDGYGPMQWKKQREIWKISLFNIGGGPGFVTVCGIEGCDSIPTELK